MRNFSKAADAVRLMALLTAVSVLWSVDGLFGGGSENVKNEQHKSGR